MNLVEPDLDREAGARREGPSRLLVPVGDLRLEPILVDGLHCSRARHDEVEEGNGQRRDPFTSAWIIGILSLRWTSFTSSTNPDNVY